MDMYIRCEKQRRNNKIPDEHSYLRNTYIHLEISISKKIPFENKKKYRCH